MLRLDGERTTATICRRCWIDATCAGGASSRSWRSRAEPAASTTSPGLAARRVSLHTCS